MRVEGSSPFKIEEGNDVHSNRVKNSSLQNEIIKE